MLIFVLAIVQSILYGWVLGIERGEREAHYGAQFQIPRFVQWVLKYVTPVYLLAVFAGNVYAEIGSYQDRKGIVYALQTNSVAAMSFAWLLAVLAFLLLAVHISGRRWEAEGRLSRADREVRP
jgi:hypothetical protein